MSRGHFIGLNHHRLMLADQVRMAAYQKAISMRVKPGMRVLDLGTGTGILALWAAQAGAEVVAIEPHDVIEVAKRVAEANDCLDRITFIRDDSRRVTLDQPVDLVVTECMGNFFVTDEMQPVLRDLPRHLAPGGATMPLSISMHLAAASLPMWAQRELGFWLEPIGGFDFSPAFAFASQISYVVNSGPEFLASDARQAASFPLMEAPDRVQLDCTLTVDKSRTLHALLGWFEADLGAGVVLSTAPGVQTHWGQMAFPLPPARVTHGDTVEVTLVLDMDDQGQCYFRWSGIIRRSEREDMPFSRDTRKRFEPEEER